MIFDTIQNWKHYTHLGSGIAHGLELLSSGKLDTLAVGKHLLDGEKLFASVQEYVPKEPSECRWEAHRAYLDIQYLVKGRELMGYCPGERLTISEPYNEKKDVMFFKEGSKFGTLLNVAPKMVAIFFPQEGHMPQMALKSGQTSSAIEGVKKIVLKIKLL